MKKNSKKNIIVIISDTLRKDHLGCYGNKKIYTPNIDTFSSKSTIFENFYSASFPTMPARADLYTGKLTLTYIGWNPMPVGEVILPVLLKNCGYTTAAVVDTPFYVRNGFNYDRGFDYFIENYGQSTGNDYAVYNRVYEKDYFAPKTFSTAAHWLEQHYDKSNPFFLLIDTWDPHEPWNPPRWYVKQYRNNYKGEVIEALYGKLDEGDIRWEEVEIAHDCYSGEISMVDTWFGYLMEKLKIMKLLEDTVVIFTTDHGFYFGEHQIFGKGIMEEPPMNRPDRSGWLRCPLYEEIINIPLLIYSPNERVKKVKELISYIDLMPTILDLAEVEKPEFLHGDSFIDAIKGSSSFRGRDFVISSFPLYNPGAITKIVDAFARQVKEYLPSTITTPEWSLIYSAEEEVAELYNLKSDPKQEKNVISDYPDIANSLHKKYFNVLDSCNVDRILLEPRRRIKI
ncbi:MAG: sulfatase [Actinobacteria bacterium]|nr:sulfatase [Actinomycetota bacterium]